MKTVLDIDKRKLIVIPDSIWLLIAKFFAECYCTVEEYEKLKKQNISSNEDSVG